MTNSSIRDHRTIVQLAIIEQFTLEKVRIWWATNFARFTELSSIRLNVRVSTFPLISEVWVGLIVYTESMAFEVPGFVGRGERERKREDANEIYF